MSDPFLDSPMLVGKVLRVNSKGTGFILDCKPEDWVNKSKLRNRRQDLPPVGFYVEVPFELYNDAIYMIDWRPTEPTQTVEQCMSDQTAAVKVALHAGEIHDDKPVVTRLACLNAALDFWNPGNMKFSPNTGEAVDGYSLANILSTAEVFVAWAKGASIPAALAVINPSEPLDAGLSEANGSPEPEPSDFEPSSDIPAGSPTAKTGSSSSLSRTPVSSKR